MVYTFIEFFVQHIQCGWMELWNVLSKTSMHQQCIYTHICTHLRTYTHSYQLIYVYDMYMSMLLIFIFRICF